MSTNIVQSRDPEREKRQQAQAEQEQALVRNRLVQKLLQPTPDLRQYLHDLVYTQAVVVAGTEAAAFLLHVNEKNEGNLENIAHIRPDGSAEDVKKKALQAFSDIIAQCINEGRDGIVQVSDDMDLTMEPQFCLVTLLRAEGRVVAATSVIKRSRNQALAQQSLDVMQVVAGYFDYFMLRRRAEAMQQMTASHQDVLQYATAFGTAEGFENGINNLTNEIATRTGSTRVSIGWVQGFSAEHPKVKLKGLSHTEQFDKKQELSVFIMKVMEECVDQQEIVQFDPNDPTANTANVTREAQALSRLEGGSRVITLPLRRKGDIVGVMTLEFPPTKKSTDQEATSLAVAAEMLGPVLYDRFHNDRWITTKMAHSTLEGWRMLVGPKYWLGKLIVLLVISAMAFLVLYRPTNKIKAHFAFAVIPSMKRVVSANVDAKLMKVNAYPGMTVHRGDILAEFDKQEVLSQIAKASADLDNAIKEQRQAEADFKEGHQTTDVAMQKMAAVKAAKANLDLYNYQETKFTITAPMDGKILNGDLTDKVGKQMQKGETMFEIADAKPENLRVEIQVPERDIQQVFEPQMGPKGELIHPGSKGEIRTSALPGQAIKIVVDRVVPQGSPKENKNIFMVYAHVVEDKAVGDEIRRNWAPGMEGEAQIEDQPKSLIYQWSRDLVDKTRLFLWF